MVCSMLFYKSIILHIIMLYLIMLLSSVMTTSTPEKQDGLKALGDAIEVIQNKITSLGGVFNVQMAVSFE